MSTSTDTSVQEEVVLKRICMAAATIVSPTSGLYNQFRGNPLEMLGLLCLLGSHIENEPLDLAKAQYFGVQKERLSEALQIVRCEIDDCSEVVPLNL